MSASNLTKRRLDVLHHPSYKNLKFAKISAHLSNLNVTVEVEQNSSLVSAFDIESDGSVESQTLSGEIMGEYIDV